MSDLLSGEIMDNIKIVDKEVFDKLLFNDKEQALDMLKDDNGNWLEYVKIGKDENGTDLKYRVFSDATDKLYQEMFKKNNTSLLPDNLRALFIFKIDYQSKINRTDYRYWYFLNVVNFKSSTFNAEITFDSAVFTSYAFFNSITFMHDAIFRSATFFSEANFRSSTFRGYTFFNFTKFIGYADFISCYFIYNVNYTFAKFKNKAYFRLVTFNRKANYNSVIFNDEANFNSVTFNDEANFNSVTFNDEANFNSVTFNDEVTFKTSTFEKFATFKSAIFIKKSYFSTATFNNGAVFSFAYFDGMAFLYNTILKGSIYFDSAQFKINDIEDVYYINLISFFGTHTFIFTNAKVIIEGKKKSLLNCILEYKAENNIKFQREILRREITFPPEYKQAGLNILNYFDTVLREKYPDMDVKVTIQQEGLKVRMIVESPDSENKEIIEKEFQDYGSILIGKKRIEEIYRGNQLLIVDLRNQLRSAYLIIEGQKDLIKIMSEQIEEQKNDKKELHNIIKTQQRTIDSQAITVEGFQRSFSGLLGSGVNENNKADALLRGQFCVLRGDIKGFSRYMEVNRGFDISSQFEQIVNGSLGYCECVTVKDGDSILIIEQNADRIAAAGLEIIRKLRMLIKEGPEIRLAVDYGEIGYFEIDGKIVPRDGNILRTVARIEPAVTPGQLWGTRSFRNHLENEKKQLHKVVDIDCSGLDVDDQGFINVKKVGGEEKDFFVELYRIVEV